MHAWISAIVIRASHNGLSHRQQHLRSRLKATLLLGQSSARTLLSVLGLEKITAAWLRKSPPRRGFVVSSFLPEVLQALHAEDSAIPLGLICETRAELSLWRRLPIEYVIPHHRLADAALIRKIRTAGKRMLVWTVNAPADMQRFAESGVDGIISDDTGLLRRLLTE